MEQSDLRRLALAGAGIAMLLGLAIGGGALFAGTGTTATAGGAWPFAVVGAVLGIVALIAAVVLVRSLFPDAWSTVRSSLLVAAAIAVALGVLLGAGLAPDSAPADDETAEAEPPTDDPESDPSEGEGRAGDNGAGDARAGGAAGGAGGVGGGTTGSGASVVSVDADGDGVADTDANGQPVLGIDQNGDGLVDSILIPCPVDSSSDRSAPGTVVLDQNCDGTADFTLELDDTVLLGASPQIATRLEELEALDIGLDDLDLDDLPDDLDSLEESELTVEDLEDLGLDADETPEQLDQDDAENDDGASLPWGALFGMLLVGVLALAAIAAVCALVVALVRGTLRRTAKAAPPPTEAPPADDEEDAVDLGPAIASSLNTLEHDLDPRAGICAAYGTLLERLAESGLARRPEEAPEEHMLRCLDGASLPERPVRELLDLFTIARFSTHPVTERHRQAAVAAMREVLAATNAPLPPGPPVAVGQPAGWAPPSGTLR